LRPEALVDACEATMAHNGLTHARVRLTITGGDMNLLAQRPEDVRHDPTVLIHVQPPTPYPPALFEQGVGVRIADGQLNVADPFAGHKTLWYWPRLAALQRAAEAGMQEAALASLENIEVRDNATHCLFNPDWHQGVIGIVASRLKEKFYRPTITFAPAGDGMIKGSGR
jgi:branched-subunit amino acid aminotransferase/4-amino-4-deoxychorismate lyase